jgi:hypothetical protein
MSPTEIDEFLQEYEIGVKRHPDGTFRLTYVTPAGSEVFVVGPDLAACCAALEEQIYYFETPYWRMALDTYLDWVPLLFVASLVASIISIWFGLPGSAGLVFVTHIFYISLVTDVFWPSDVQATRFDRWWKYAAYYTIALFSWFIAAGALAEIVYTLLHL